MPGQGMNGRFQYTSLRMQGCPSADDPTGDVWRTLIQELDEPLRPPDAHVAHDVAAGDLPDSTAAPSVGKGDHHLSTNTLWQLVGNNGDVVAITGALEPAAARLHDLVIEACREEPGQSALQHAGLHR